MKMWNCFMMYRVNDELDSTESYGIFSTLEAAIEDILKTHQVGNKRTECDDDDVVCWVITENEVLFSGISHIVYGYDITLKNVCNEKETEELYFHIERHEVDKG